MFQGLFCSLCLFFNGQSAKGRPTYVAVWEAQDKKIKLVEVLYVGTHEKAPY
jgi:hypothetical protein